MKNKELGMYIEKVDTYRRQCAYRNQFEVAGLLRDVLEFLKRWQKVNDSGVDNGWILCSDRLPPTDHEVIMCRNKRPHKISIGYYNESLGWYDQTLLHLVDDVVAWMPLPDPYKEV